MNSLKSLFRITPSLMRNSVCVRNFTISPIRFDTPHKITETHRVDNLEKRFLVWTKKYKRVEDVPQYVAPDVMERARNIMRIRIANIMMALTLLGCLLMVWSGKKARERGETVEQQNLMWHKKMQEQEAAK